MANIDNELSQIKNSIYGNEMRTAIANGIEKLSKRDVRYDEDQNLTDTQKLQARKNIGLSVIEDTTKVSFTEDQNLTDTQKLQARKNIGIIEEGLAVSDHMPISGVQEYNAYSEGSIVYDIYYATNNISESHNRTLLAVMPYTDTATIFVQLFNANEYGIDYCKIFALDSYPVVGRTALKSVLINLNTMKGSITPDSGTKYIALQIRFNNKDNYLSYGTKVVRECVMMTKKTYSGEYIPYYEDFAPKSTQIYGEMLSKSKLDRQGEWHKADTNITVESGRWNFISNSADISSSGSNEQYCRYEIQENDNVIGFRSYYWDDVYRACGFYDENMHLIYTPKYNNGTAITKIMMLGIPNGAKYFIVNLGTAISSRGVYLFDEIGTRDTTKVSFTEDQSLTDTQKLQARKNIGIIEEGLAYTRIFVHTDFENADYNYTYKDICYGDGAIYATPMYRTSFPWNLTRVKTSNGELSKGPFICNKYRILLNINGQAKPIYEIKDTNGNNLQSSNMTYYDGYLYIAYRAGAPAAGSTETNSYMVVIKCADLPSSDGDVTACAYYGYGDCVSTIRVDATRKILFTGNRGEGFSVYDITNPENPQLITTHIDANIYEIQHGCAYTDGNNNTVLAFGCYTTGISAYKLDNGNITNLFRWNNLSKYGNNLNCFSVEVNYPYLYGTVSATNSARLHGDNTMGIVALDIRDTDNVRELGFFPIPEKHRGHWVAAAKATNSGITLRGTMDPEPNYLRIYNNKLYVNNEDAGIAVYDLSEPETPKYIGNIETGVWSRYFWLEPPLIFVCEYASRSLEPSKIVGVTTVLE